MGHACTVCTHPSRGAIEELVRSGRSGRSVALEHGLSPSAMKRHIARHLLPTDAGTIVLDGPVDALDELVAHLRARALAGNPSDTREYRLALAALDDRRHATAPVVELEATAEWQGLRARILDALAPFPEARVAVAEAIRR